MRLLLPPRCVVIETVALSPYLCALLRLLVVFVQLLRGQDGAQTSPLRRMDGQRHRSRRSANHHHHRRREPSRLPRRHPRYQHRRQVPEAIREVRHRDLHGEGHQGRFLLEAVQALHRFENCARRRADAVIISTGAVVKRLSFAGSGEGADGFWNGGISACAVCDSATPNFRNKPLVVIGGGNSAEETRQWRRRDTFRASKIMQQRKACWWFEGWVCGAKPGTTKTSVVGVFVAGDGKIRAIGRPLQLQELWFKEPILAF
ncbi:hypothetical protein IGI04_001582 [Brassica rapa subsp. trilocularis]|uniref:Uncharacterized protein n=1 Tax=Brassica rapa subsp. trilocularis TaxID=1813537 RepID=A0ABQ7NT25_BRACM|nr:hypothetical protein IGI04_001582 [Brassica rapa subsp. trilocularis]